MARRRTRSRIYWRERGGQRRAYADFRDYCDVGGGREALIPAGQKAATNDPLVAEKLVVDRLKQLQDRRRNRAVLDVDRQVDLAEFASHHLVQKARSGRFTDQWLATVELHLQSAVAFFGADRDLASIRVADVQSYVTYLQAVPNGRGGTLSGGSIRK